MKASELLSNGKVAVRVSELQEQARKRHEVTIDTLTAELDEARQQAKDDPKGASAHVAAIMGKAKLHGLLVDRQDHSSTDGSMTPQRIEIVAVGQNDDDSTGSTSS